MVECINFPYHTIAGIPRSTRKFWNAAKTEKRLNSFDFFEWFHREHLKNVTLTRWRVGSLRSIAQRAVSLHRLVLRVVLRCRVERANEPSERSEPASERANATFKCPLCGIIQKIKGIQPFSFLAAFQNFLVLRSIPVIVWYGKLMHLIHIPNNHLWCCKKKCANSKEHNNIYQTQQKQPWIIWILRTRL
jgi:hypothetical protein